MPVTAGRPHTGRAPALESLLKDCRNPQAPAGWSGIYLAEHVGMKSSGIDPTGSEKPLREESARYVPLDSYALIGDCRSAALVSREGSIDWCCWPNFDSPSVFGRLLDYEKGGFFAISPTAAFETTRSYIGPTSVLQTTFRTATGTARLTDLMPALTEAQKRQRPIPFRQILRRVEGIEGNIEMELGFVPRPDYGREAPTLDQHGPFDALCSTGAHLLQLRSDLPLAPRGSDIHQRFVLGAGERADFALAFSQDAPAVFPNVGPAADQDISDTLDFWHGWMGKFQYSGPYREAVMRSALVLKLMSFAPSGAIVAAPTTSLPEEIGAARNWDYRYCWLRDASFTIRALYDLGFDVEGDAFVNWMLHSTRLTHPAVQILYTLYGESHVPESVLDHMEGYRGSAPVRIGNGASSQFQIDVYGEVVEGLERYHSRGGRLDREAGALLTGAAELVARRWREPDHGIWELRGGKAHYVHGKALAWRALDSAARLARKVGIRAPIDRWERARDEIRAAILTHGFDPEMNSFVQAFGRKEVDGALLSLPLTGLLPADDPRLLGTIDAVRRQLGVDELIYRQRDGTAEAPSTEGTFLTCSFWLVSALALGGRIDEAHRVFGKLRNWSNDLALFSEEADPSTGELLGNYPQALTHLALINAALVLRDCEEKGPAAATRAARP